RVRGRGRSLWAGVVAALSVYTLARAGERFSVGADLARRAELRAIGVGLATRSRRGTATCRSHADSASAPKLGAGGLTATWANRAGRGAAVRVLHAAAFGRRTGRIGDFALTAVAICLRTLLSAVGT